MPRTTKPRPKPQYLSLEDAAATLGVSPATIRRLIMDGKLPGYRIGGKMVRVHIDDIHGLVEPILPNGVGSE
jgi:excisionase family DNA binding protein